MLQVPLVIGEGARLLDRGLDWVRLSWVGEKAQHAPTFDMLRLWYDQRVLGGETADSPRPKNLLGYVGRGYGAMWMGERNDDILFQASGNAARHILSVPGVAQAVCTRLDIQATFRASSTPTDIIARAARRALAAREGKTGRPCKINHIVGFGDGDTLQINARSNPEYMRVYDKELESGGAELWRGAVRFELELKGDASRHVWEQLCVSRETGSYLNDVLCGSFSKHGITELARLLGASPLLLDIPRPATDAEKKLAWLQQQVRPTVEWLLRNGYEDGTLFALGLQ